MKIEGRSIDRVAVVGAGFIGMGWAIVFARAGLTVLAHDADLGALDRLPERIATALTRMRHADWLTAADAESILSRIRCCPTLAEALASVQYVQESVPEDLSLKQSAITEIDRLLPPETVIGSSTSGIPMTAIATGARYPERCVVVHPTNPPHIVPLVEIVPGKQTAPETVDFARALMEAVGQSPIVCRKEIPGFVLNRLQFALTREAFYLAREGVASVADIDRTISDGLGLRWALIGPFLVEETNAGNIRDDLTKFGAAIEELIADVCRPFGGLGPEDIDLAEEGVRELMGQRSHDDLIAYRDELILRIRSMRASWG